MSFSSFNTQWSFCDPLHSVVHAEERDKGHEVPLPSWPRVPPAGREEGTGGSLRLSPHSWGEVPHPGLCKGFCGWCCLLSPANPGQPTDEPPQWAERIPQDWEVGIWAREDAAEGCHRVLAAAGLEWAGVLLRGVSPVLCLLWETQERFFNLSSA